MLVSNICPSTHLHPSMLSTAQTLATKEGTVMTQASHVRPQILWCSLSHTGTTQCRNLPHSGTPRPSSYHAINMTLQSYSTQIATPISALCAPVGASTQQGHPFSFQTRPVPSHRCSDAGTQLDPYQFLWSILSLHTCNHMSPPARSSGRVTCWPWVLLSTWDPDPILWHTCLPVSLTGTQAC